MIVEKEFGPQGSKEITVKAFVGEDQETVIKRIKEQLVLENYFSEDVRTRAISDYDVTVVEKFGYSDDDYTGYRLFVMPKSSQMFTEEEVERMATKGELDSLKKEEEKLIKELSSEWSDEEKELFLKKELKPQGLRYNTGKNRLELVPYDALLAMSEVLTFGASKYEDRNWEKGMNYSVAFSSLMRHLIAFWNGEDKDKESGLDHMAHVLCNAAFLYRFTKMEGLDDRPKQKEDK